jgi:hypothetical protein
MTFSLKALRCKGLPLSIILKFSMFPVSQLDFQKQSR